MNKRMVGSGYEEVAAAYLRKEGYQILEKNFRDRQGEIDLIARDGIFLVFVEVKYRKDRERGYPQEAVTPKKQRTIRKTALYYLYTHGLGEETPCRFDVVAILGDEILLLKDAF